MLISAPDVSVESRITRRRLMIEVPSDFVWITPTVEYLTDRISDVPWHRSINRNGVALALHEALTNSIVHGNLEVSSCLKNEDNNRFAETLATRSTQHRYASRTVSIVVDYNAERITWSLADEGNGFDVQRVLEKAEEEEVSLLPSGRGVMMIKAFMDDVEYDRGGSRVKLTIRNPNSESGRLSPLDHDELQTILDPVLESLSIDDDDLRDRRTDERHPLSAKFYIDVPGDVRKPAFARNISKGGLGFICAAPLESSNLTVDLVLNGHRVRIDSEIVRCTELVPNVFDVGVRFQQKSQ